MAKVDIQDAIRIVPVHPDDRWLLGMQWEGKTYIDSSLPFGLRSAPKIFNTLADVLEWTLSHKGVQWIIHYLDDFLMLGAPGTSQCSQALATTLATCDRLGCPIAPHKTVGPVTLIDFLGIQLDSTSMQLRLPKQKLINLRLMIAKWQRRRSCTKRELLSLIGHLSHACKVVKPGRPFLRCLIELSTKAKKPHHHLRLNLETSSDLLWWAFFLQEWNGVSMLSSITKLPHEVVVTSDASGTWGTQAHIRTNTVFGLGCCYLLVLFSSSYLPSLNLLTIIIGSVCFLALSPDVYKKRMLTLLERSFFVNLSVTSAATLYSMFTEGYMSVIANISIGIAFTTFIAIFYHSWKRITKIKPWKGLTEWFHRRQTGSCTTDRELVNVVTTDSSD